MLDFLFQRLTTPHSGGTALFAAATAEARRPHWFRNGQVPDTIDGRFAVLATIVALLLVRLEHEGDSGNALSVALTERFIAVMESEHRELGLGDPALGKTVRKLVGALAKRTELWRGVVAGACDWGDAITRSLYKGEEPASGVQHAGDALKVFWSSLERSDAKALAEGRFE